MAGEGDWHIPTETITIPEFAGPGDARIVISPAIPPELTAYYAADDKTVVGCVLYYDVGPSPGVDGNYHYEACVTHVGVAFYVARGVWDTVAITEYLLSAVGDFSVLRIDQLTAQIAQFDNGDNFFVNTPREMQPWTPNVTGNVSDPNFGNGGNFAQTGWWTIDPLTGWADAEFFIRFGTAGVSAGSGTYNIELPWEIELLANQPNDAVRGLSTPLGTGTIRDNSNIAASTDVHILAKNAAGGPNGGAQVQMLVMGGGVFVGSAAPWTWNTSDAMFGRIRCRPII